MNENTASNIKIKTTHPRAAELAKVTAAEVAACKVLDTVTDLFYADIDNPTMQKTYIAAQTTWSELFRLKCNLEHLLAD